MNADYLQSLSRQMEQQANGASLVDIDGNEATIILDGTEIYISSMEGWVQVRALAIVPDVIRARGTAFLATSLLLIQFRLIGCRFAFDEDGALWTIADIPANQATSDYVESLARQCVYLSSLISEKMSFIIDLERPLLDSEVDIFFS